MFSHAVMAFVVVCFPGPYGGYSWDELGCYQLGATRSPEREAEWQSNNPSANKPSPVQLPKIGDWTNEAGTNRYWRMEVENGRSVWKSMTVDTPETKTVDAKRKKKDKPNKKPKRQK